MIMAGFAQNGFDFNKGQKKIKIPFKLVNNLIIIPIEVNNVKMNFLLDSGVDDTVLFSLQEKAEVELYNIEKIGLKGLGSFKAVEGLKSSGNMLTFSGHTLRNQQIIVILDETFNFSLSLGVPVNGIIGYQFFKNNLVEINYESKNIYVHNKAIFKPSRLKSYEELPISIEKNKPYVLTNVIFETTTLASKLLIDCGNSDAVWIFQRKLTEAMFPKNNFEDYLGRGFSGDILGKRAIIKGFKIKQFNFENPLIAMPDSTSLRNAVLVQDRLGSMGAGILKRFNVYFDYDGSKLYLKSNKFRDEPFSFNKSGITIQNAGLQFIQEKIFENTRSNIIKIEFGEREVNLKYKFELKPIYEITNIRKGSPADEVGLQKGDIIVAVNNVFCYKYSLEQLNSIFKSEEGRVILLDIKRNNVEMRKKIKLRSIL